VTSSGGFPAGSEFNKRLTASIDSVEKGKVERKRERERREILRQLRVIWVLDRAGRFTTDV